MTDLCCVFVGIWIVCSIFALLGFAVDSDNRNISIEKSLKYFITNMFSNKNWFGILLNIIICILLIPVYLYILIIELVCVVKNVFVYIWRLGIKN